MQQMYQSACCLHIPMKCRDLPVGVFDSGLGGLSVLRELKARMPHENFLYFGDSKNAPYGSRPPEEILNLTEKAAELLFDRGIKALVLACNTATSIGAEFLREKYPEEIIVGIEPALKPAVERFPRGRILVLATETTLREKKFNNLMARASVTCDICKCPCPRLVEFVERGELEGPRVEAVIRSQLEGKLNPPANGVVLGCTHFPFLRDAVSHVVGPEAVIFDGAEGTARETKRRLEEADLLRRDGEGKTEILNSLESREILELSERLLRA